MKGQYIISSCGRFETTRTPTLLRVAGPGEYDILWDAEVVVDSDSESSVSDEGEYSETPAAAAVKLMERYLDAQLAGIEGGVLDKLSRALKASPSQAARLAEDMLRATSSPAFVYDFVAANAKKRIADLKYVNDAAAKPSPLKPLNDAAFLKEYKIERRLHFHQSTAPLRSLRLTDWWNAVYQ